LKKFRTPQGQVRPKIILKINAKIFWKLFFQKIIFCIMKKRILENICRIWHLSKENLPKEILFGTKVPNLNLPYGRAFKNAYI
jgi:hypothetical protein